MMLRACLAFAVCMCLAAGPAWADTAEVAATSANLRSAPGTSSPVVATLARGARLEVLDVSGDWLKVRVVETKAVGWVHRRLVEVLPPTGGAHLHRRPRSRSRRRRPPWPHRGLRRR